MPYDMWWPLEDPEISHTVTSALDQYGLPWLDSLSDRDAILHAYERDGRAALGMHPASPPDIADLLRGMGRTDESRRVLTDYISTTDQNADYLKKYLLMRGEEDLAPMVHMNRPASS